MREKEEEDHFLSAYCIVDNSVIGLLFPLSHLILMEFLPDRYYHFPHITNEGSKTQSN